MIRFEINDIVISISVMSTPHSIIVIIRHTIITISNLTIIMDPSQFGFLFVAEWTGREDRQEIDATKGPIPNLVWVVVPMGVSYGRHVSPATLTGEAGWPS